MAIMGILGMLIFGTMTSIFSKLMLDTRYCPKYDPEVQVNIEPYKGDNCPEYVKTTFSKPWFQTLTMFFAMTFCLAIHGCGLIYNNRKTKKQAYQTANEIIQQENQDTPIQQQSQIPCLFDMIASSVMTYGLVYIDVSIMQMLRGAMVVFSALFNIWCLKRKIRPYQWVAVAGTCIALILVGVSCILTSSSSSGYSWEYQLLGCCLVLLSAAIQACQLVVEDHLLANLSQPPNVIVGFEGLFGVIFTAICLIVLYFIPGSDDGSAENAIDSFYAFGTDQWICLFSCMFMIGCLGLNLSGMIVTQQTSSVVRAVMESVRTILIWVVDLLIYYLFWPNSVYGESWSTYSWIQLAGFILLIFASQMYNGYVKFPAIFKYVFYDQQEQKQIIEDDKEEVPLLNDQSNVVTTQSETVEQEKQQ